MIQIIGIIKDTIGLADGQTTFCPAIYELDTEKKNGDFIEKFQATIDIILLKMQMIIKVNGEVNTENIKFCGVIDRLKKNHPKKDKNSFIVMIKKLLIKFYLINFYY